MKFLSLSIGGTTIPMPTQIQPIADLSNPLERIIQVALTWLLIFGVIFALFSIIFSGAQWIMSEGDKQKVQNARNRLMYSIIGLIVVLLALFIINVVKGLFGIPAT